MLQTKQIKYIKAKLEGKNQEQAGLEAGATTIDGARALATRLSKNVEVIEALQASQQTLLIEAGITRMKALKPIGEALEATKTIVMGKDSDESFVDIIPDHATRLKAADMALKLLDKAQDPTDNPQGLTKENLAALLDETDEIKLQQLVFKRKDV